MARKDSNNQKRSMSAMFRGRAIFKPLNTGRIDERVACVREWVANIFFFTNTSHMQMWLQSPQYCMSFNENRLWV